jgi:hypothetical protein
MDPITGRYKTAGAGANRASCRGEVGSCSATGVYNMVTKKRLSANPRLPNALSTTKEAMVFFGRLRLRPMTG